MSANSFLDKGIILGYCFFTDPHYKRCREYIHSGDTDYFATEQVEDIYPNAKKHMVRKHQQAILNHIRDIKRNYSGSLTESKIQDIKESIDTYDNPSWRFLQDYYDGKEGETVYNITEGLRDIQQEIEQTAEKRKSELYPMLQGWIRFAQHEDVQENLSGLKAEDEEDFWICIDAHDLAASIEGKTELATPNPADFGENGYQDEILEYTAIDSIRIVAISRDRTEAK